MINVDTVYKTVQRLMNIEQRGQLPPDDFNHFAKLAQEDLFNQTISDLAHFKLNPKEGEMNLQEQIDIFHTTSEITKADNLFALPEDIHTLTTVLSGAVVVDVIDHKVSPYIMASSLSKPTATFPKYLRINGASGVGSIRVLPESGDDEITTITVDYIKKPSLPKWVGVEIQGTELFNGSASTNFELHNSREDDLIVKILLYAGLSIKQQDIVAFASGSMQQEEASEKQ